MTIRSRFALAAITLLLPFSSAAADVPNVTGISATVSSGSVTVSWDRVAGNIQAYRIFMSRESILETGGIYDDYEDAPGTVGSYTLRNPPSSSILYISVLAVDQTGNESPYFMEETSVKLGAKSSSSASSAPASTTMRFLSAASTSTTGVTLLFSHPVSIGSDVTTPFRITTGSGNVLRIVRYSVEGERAIIVTEPQVSGRVYRIAVDQGVRGTTAAGKSIALEQDTAPLLFTGSQAEQSETSEVRALTLAVNGTTVEARWIAPSGIRELQVQQSIDGGATFGPVARMEPTANGVVIPGISNGTFTLLVKTVASDGTVSRGVRESVQIGDSAGSSKPTTASSSRATSTSSTPTTKPGTLPSSGLEIATILTLSGAVTGMRFARRKNARSGQR